MITLLEAILKDSHTFTGAACTGKAPLFDAYVEGETESERLERHAIAAIICDTCPVFQKCRASVSPSDTGFYAGEYMTGDRFNREDGAACVSCGTPTRSAHSVARWGLPDGWHARFKRGVCSVCRNEWRRTRPAPNLPDGAPCGECGTPTRSHWSAQRLGLPQGWSRRNARGLCSTCYSRHWKRSMGEMA